MGLSTQYQQIKIDPLEDAVWEGVRNKYWHFHTYFLPVCSQKMAEGTAEAEGAATDAQLGQVEQQAKHS